MRHIESFLKKKAKGIELLSVDLFDTLVTRSFAFPADVFYTLEEKLTCEAGGEKLKNFAEARIKSEFQLREEKGFAREVTLDEIYVRLQTDLELTKTQAENIRDMELAIETQCIFPIPSIVDVVKKIKDDLKLKVILISDTYLPEVFIVKILDKHKLSGLFDRLYISSSHGATKSTGSLFRVVRQEENIPVKKWLHLGDNEASDHKAPRKMGIRVFGFKEAFLTRFEKTFAPCPNSAAGHSVFAAVLRQARLHCPYKKDSEKLIWDTTIAVSAPLIIAYVRWCLTKAEESRVKRIYFLARDGQILFKIAGILNRSSSSPIDIRYLYVSRQSLLFPAMQGIDDESLAWILLPTSIVTPRIILNRVNIEPGEIVPFLEKYGFQNSDRMLRNTEISHFDHLLHEPGVRSLIEERILVYRETAWGYLQQEGLMEDNKFILVDIGWNGSLQRSISRLLEMKGENFPVNGLYFGLRRTMKHKPADKSDTFFFSPGNPQGLEKESHIIPIIELFTAADHGGVVKYEHKNNRYQPVLRNSENAHGIRWGIRIQQHAMTHLAERIEGQSFDDLLPGIYQNLRQFVRNPSLQEAQVYGSYLDAEDQNESYYFPLAQKYNSLELFRHYKYGYRHHHNEWVEGARRLSRGLFGRYLRRRWTKKNEIR